MREIHLRGTLAAAVDTDGVRANPLDGAPARTIATAVRRGGARSSTTGAVRDALAKSLVEEIGRSPQRA